MPLPRSSQESAAEIPEICHSLSSRYAEIASVARNERERPLERAMKVSGCRRPASNLQRDGRFSRARICKGMRGCICLVEPLAGVWICDATRTLSGPGCGAGDGLRESLRVASERPGSSGPLSCAGGFKCRCCNYGEVMTAPFAIQRPAGISIRNATFDVLQVVGMVAMLPKKDKQTLARTTTLKPGNPGGPGRPKGSPNKINRGNDFERCHVDWIHQDC
jgi:hypothetical protein